MVTPAPWLTGYETTSYKNEQSGARPFCMHRGLLIEYLNSELPNKHMNEYILHWMTYILHTSLDDS